MLSADEIARKPCKPTKAKGASKGRFALLNAFVDFSMGELSRAEIIVWLILYRDSKEGIARQHLAAVGTEPRRRRQPGPQPGRDLHRVRPQNGPTAGDRCVRVHIRPRIAAAASANPAPGTSGGTLSVRSVSPITRENRGPATCPP